MADGSITPHFAFPFTFEEGAAVVDDQGTLAEITSCVDNVVECFIGDCPDIPDFGIENPLFINAPVNTAAIQAAINLWEPRADVTITEVADPTDPTGASRIVNIEIEVAS